MDERRPKIRIYTASNLTRCAGVLYVVGLRLSSQLLPPLSLPPSIQVHSALRYLSHSEFVSRRAVSVPSQVSDGAIPQVPSQLVSTSTSRLGAPPVRTKNIPLATIVHLLYLLRPLDSFDVVGVMVISLAQPRNWLPFTMVTSRLYVGAGLALFFFVAHRILRLFKLRNYPSAPGPALAKYTNWWYLWKISGGKFQYWDIDQHAKHGTKR